MTSYKSELELGLPFTISNVVRAYMKEKGDVTRKELEALIDDINHVVSASTYSIYCTLCREDDMEEKKK